MRSWDEATIKEKFGEFGTVTSTLVQKDQKGPSFAFVNFEDAEMAKKAIEALEGKEEEEKKEEEPEDHGLFVGRAMSKAERARKLAEKFGPVVKGKGKGKGKGGDSQTVNLYIKNLDESITDDKLKELFCTFG